MLQVPSGDSAGTAAVPFDPTGLVSGTSHRKAVGLAPERGLVVLARVLVRVWCTHAPCSAVIALSVTGLHSVLKTSSN